MTENLQEPIAEDISTDPVNPLESIMGNTDIGKLAEEVSSQLDLESMMGNMDSDNPMEIFQNLMIFNGCNKFLMIFKCFCALLYDIHWEKGACGRIKNNKAIKSIHFQLLFN